jgi:hypothetical protein
MSQPKTPLQSHCNEPMTKDMGWRLCQREPKALGGSDKLSNLHLLHRTCTRQIPTLMHWGRRLR